MSVVRMQVVLLTRNGGAFPLVALPGSNTNNLDDAGGEAGIVSTEQASAHMVGVAVHDVDTGARLWVLKVGILRECDTSAWAVGDVLWSDATGSPTNVTPPATRARIRIGMVMVSHLSAGVVWVDVRALPAIGDLTGVNVSSVAEFQVLQWVDSGGTLVLQNVQPGDPDTVAPLDASARIPDQHLRWSRFLMMMGD